MELRKADWMKIEICFSYLAMLEKKLDEYTTDEKTKQSISFFYNMVLNVALYEFALAYSGVMHESNDVIKNYLKKYFGKFNKKEQSGGFFDGEFKL